MHRFRFVALTCLLGLIAGGCSGKTSTVASAPDQQKDGSVAFIRFFDKDENSSAIFVKSLDGTKDRQITHPAAGSTDNAPEWTPDGSRIAFVHIDGPDGNSAFWTVAPDGSDMTKIGLGCTHAVLNCNLDAPAFSPDGRLIAYSYGWGRVDDKIGQIEHSQVYVMQADGTKPRPVASFAAWSGDAGNAEWSPDGQQLLFERATNSASKPPNSRALFIVNADGSGLRQLTPWSLQAGGVPGWSSANLIAFRAVADEESGTGNFFTIHPDGTGLKQITHFQNTVISHRASFSADGKWIIVGHHTGTSAKTDLFIMRSDGSGARDFTNTPSISDTAADWGPSA